MAYKRSHHRKINEILDSFNREFFEKNNLLYGGGSRIVLELGEYRASSVVSVFCPSRESYLEARQQVNNNSLGELANNRLNLPRGVRADRDAIRTIAVIQNTPIKIEFIRLSGYSLMSGTVPNLFPVPFLDRISCFCIKLLANADQYNGQGHKDILDILAMSKAWGGIPNKAVELAEEQYGAIILPNLNKALEKLIHDPHKLVESAENLRINHEIINNLIDQATQLKSEKFS